MVLVTGVLIGLGLYLWWIAKDCYFVVEEGHVAVVTRFGAAKKNKEGQLLLAGPGLHFKWSFERVRKVSLREQLVTLGGEHGPEPMMLHDGTVIRLQAMLRYAPTREGIAAYVFGLHHRKEHVSGLFSSVLRNEIANVKAQAAQTDFTALGEDLGGAFALVRRDRNLVNDNIADFVRKNLSDYGVNFESIDITDIHPPDELADALNAVMSARAEAEAMRFRGQSECAQRVMAAERGVHIAQLKAGAVEAEIIQLGQHLQVLHQGGVLEAYVDRRKAEVLAEAKTLYIKDDARLIGSVP